jgi:hypothetical protein
MEGFPPASYANQRWPEAPEAAVPAQFPRTHRAIGDAYEPLDADATRSLLAPIGGAPLPNEITLWRRRGAADGHVYAAKAFNKWNDANAGSVKAVAREAYFMQRLRSPFCLHAVGFFYDEAQRLPQLVRADTACTSRKPA